MTDETLPNKNTIEVKYGELAQNKDILKLIASEVYNYKGIFAFPQLNDAGRIRQQIVRTVVKLASADGYKFINPHNDADSAKMEHLADHLAEFAKVNSGILAEPELAVLKAKINSRKQTAKVFVKHFPYEPAEEVAKEVVTELSAQNPTVGI
jgi:hypothetical protein